MLITSEEWVDRQLAMKKNIYMGGELVGRDHPLIVPGRNVIAMTYDIAQEKKYKGIITTKSHIDGSEINRWCNLHRSVGDVDETKIHPKWYSQLRFLYAAVYGKRRSECAVCGYQGTG